MKEGTFKGVDGTTLYYREFGTGTPLLLCDGIGCEGYIWKHLIRYLQGGYRLIHWNYPGHGRSHMPVDMTRIGVEDLCEDMRLLLDQLGIDKALALGHSMGVQVILEFAHMFPERCAGLMPICGSYGNPLSTFKGSSMGSKLFPYIHDAIVNHKDLATFLWQTLVPTEIGYQVAIRTEVNGDLLDKNDFFPYLEHIGFIDPELFVRMLKCAQAHSAKPTLHEINVPTLIVTGQFDGFTPMWLSSEMHHLIRGSELMTMPACTHTAPIELVELFNLRVEKFLRDYFPADGKAGKSLPANEAPAKALPPVKPTKAPRPAIAAPEAAPAAPPPAVVPSPKPKRGAAKPAAAKKTAAGNGDEPKAKTEPAAEKGKPAGRARRGRA